MRRLEKQRIFSYKYKICSIESDSNNKHKRFNASLMIQSFAWRNRLFSYIHIDCTDDRMNRFRRCWLSKIRKKIWNCSVWRRNSRSYTVICKKKFTWNRCKVLKIQKESAGRVDYAEIYTVPSNPYAIVMQNLCISWKLLIYIQTENDHCVFSERKEMKESIVFLVLYVNGLLISTSEIVISHIHREFMI